MGKAKRRREAAGGRTHFANDPPAVARGHDRALRRMLQRRGARATELVPFCPFTTVLLPPSGAPWREPQYCEVLKRYRPPIALFLFALEFEDSDLPDMTASEREQAVAALHDGYSVWLFSNRAEMRQRVKQELILASSAVEGSA